MRTFRFELVLRVPDTSPLAEASNEEITEFVNEEMVGSPPTDPGLGSVEVTLQAIVTEKRPTPPKP